jgi:hypothetical protein
MTVVSFTPLPLYPGERFLRYTLGGREGPSDILDILKKTASGIEHRAVQPIAYSLLPPRYPGFTTIIKEL